MLSRFLTALLWSIWLLPPFMGALLARTLSPKLIVFGFYGLIVASILAYILKKPRSESEKPPEPLAYLRRWLKRLSWMWGLVLLCGQVAVLARILDEQDPASSLHDYAHILFEILSPWIPALRDLPSDMALHGFGERAAIVTDSYAFGYAAAMINIGVGVVVMTILILRFSLRGGLDAIPHGFGNLTEYKQLAPFLAWPFLLIAYVYFILIDAGVKVEVGRKEALPYFETDDYDLYFRILFGPGYMTVWAWALIGICSFFVGEMMMRKRGRVPKRA